MIHHVVAFRWLPEATAAQLEAAGHALRALPARIPDIRALHFGVNQAPSRDEYSHVLVVAVDDMAAVERYARHPAHVEVVERHIAPIRAARLALDVEID